MNEEKVKRGRGRPVGSLSHIGIKASDLAEYCANHPDEIVMVSRIFWEKKMAESVVATQTFSLQERILSPEEVAESDSITQGITSEYVPIPVLIQREPATDFQAPKIEMTLSE